MFSRAQLLHIDTSSVVRIDDEMLRTVAGEAAIMICAQMRAVVQSPRAFVHVYASLSIVRQLVSRRTITTNPITVLFARVRATQMAHAEVVRLLTGFGILLQLQADRALAIVRAVGIDAIVGTIVFPCILALVDILASTFLLRISVSHGTGAIILRSFSAFVRDSDARAIIFSELEAYRTGTRVGAFEILAIVAAIIRRFAFALVLVLAGISILAQDVTRRTLASIA